MLTVDPGPAACCPRPGLVPLQAGRVGRTSEVEYHPSMDRIDELREALWAVANRSGSSEIWVAAGALSWCGAVTIAETQAAQIGSPFPDMSLYGLPIRTQAVYAVLLMVPIGALVMVIMRNLVGIDAFGTFMPVLIALAFRETQLLWGIVLFTMLLSTMMIPATVTMIPNFLTVTGNNPLLPFIKWYDNWPALTIPMSRPAWMAW